MSNPNHWTFFSNHTHILVVIARNPDARVRDIAEEVGITERAVQRLIADLAESGYLVVTKEGRRNHYRIQAELPLRHPLEEHRSIADLLEMLMTPGPARTAVETEQRSAV